MFDPGLVVAALAIGAIGYALLINRRGRIRREWDQLVSRVSRR